jgi:putative ABC transport system permease protein
MVDIALKNLLHDKLRSAITIAGVAFAVTLVLVQTGLFLGVMDNASVVIDHTDADLWVTSHNTANIDFAQTFSEGAVDRVRSVPGVARADNLIVAFMNVALPNGATEGTEVYALDDFQRWGLPWDVHEGNVTDLQRGDYMFVDESATKRFGPFHVGEYREVLGRRLQIIGTTRHALSFTTSPVTFMNYRLAQMIQPTLLGGYTCYILVKLAQGADTTVVGREIARRLPYNDVHTKQGWAAQSRKYWIVSTGLGLSMYVTVFLGCLVGVVVVAQTLYTSTMEHWKEFGTVKAIGGNNADIYRILAKQALIAAVIGFVCGIVLSWGMAPLLTQLGLRLIMPLWLHGALFVGTIVFCLGAAAVSFHKVASIDPALVFRN